MTFGLMGDIKILYSFNGVLFVLFSGKKSTKNAFFPLCAIPTHIAAHAMPLKFVA
jgi:hypothetical protein